MAVLDRELFKNSKIGETSASAAKGTGITSGLVDDFNKNLETLRKLDIVPQRAKFDNFQNLAPALMTFFGALGQPVDGAAGPISAATQGVGRAAMASAPLFGEAAAAKTAYDAVDPEAGLKEMALSMAMKEKDPVTLKSMEPVYGEFQNAEGEPQIGYGFVKAYNNGDVEYEYAGQRFSSFKGQAEPETPKEETFFQAKPVKIRKKQIENPAGPTQDPIVAAGEPFDAFFQSGNQGSFRFVGIGGKGGEFNLDEYELYDPEGNFNFEGNIKVKLTGSNIEQSARQVFNKNTGNIDTILTDGTGTKLTEGGFEIVGTDDSDDQVFAQKPYKLIIDGKEFDTTGRQEGSKTFVLDPRPDSETKGKFIDAETIDGLDTFFESKVRPFRTVTEELAIYQSQLDLKEKSEAASAAFNQLISDGKVAQNSLTNYDTAIQFLEDATDGTFSPQRSAFVKLLETFNVDENMPEFYSTVRDALKAGKTVNTEVLNALAQNAFINNAQAYDDRLNNTEVGKLAAADFGITLSKEGSLLLIEINKANDQILVDGADIARNLSSGTEGGAQAIIEKYGDRLGEEVVAKIRKLSQASQDGTLSLGDASLIADNFISKSFKDFGNNEELKAKINKVLNISSVGDQSYFNELGVKDMGQTGVSVDLGQAYANGQVKFAGYPVNGEFIYDEEQTTTTGFDDNLPMYVVEFVDKRGNPYRAVLQFPKAGE
jgi:hypothetical protein